MKKNYKKAFSGGTILMQVLVFASIAVVLLSGLVGWAAVSIKAARHALYREQAVQIAEAGIDYYRWHLAHAPLDFEDGTGLPGPYLHNYYDKDGILIGTFELDIIPPPIGSTVVTVRSKGVVNAYPSIYRRIESRLAKPSWARYAVAANADMRFGAGTVVFGPIHSNGGIRFDGIANNLVTSARTDYDDPDHTGGNEFGVHTHIAPTDPLPPASVPSRTDVFIIGRQFPVPQIDFTGITADLQTIKTDAQNAGFYRTPSGALGYHVVFNSNDTFTLYRVNTMRSAPSGCTNVANQTGWGTWSIATGAGAQTLLGTYAIPGNGLIFLEDHVWVDGVINTARATVASARFPDSPSTRTSITVNNDLSYTNVDGQDTLALIAQNNINVGLFSEDDLRIDGALVAQNGRVGRFYYESDCAPNNIRSTITLLGMIATAQRYGFSFTGGSFPCAENPSRSSGYCIRNINYDSNLLYAPPPSFPLTSDQYSIISWQEID